MRFLGALVGIAVSVSTVIVIPLTLLREGWRMTNWLVANLQKEVSLPHQLLSMVDGFLSGLPFSIPLPGAFLWGVVIPAAPSYQWVGFVTIASLVLVMTCLFVVHHLIPMNARLAYATRSSISRADLGHPYQTYLNKLSEAHREGRVDLYIMADSGINALSLSSPMGRHAVVVTQGMLNQLPASATRWVLAHEFAHIVHGDTRAPSLWLLSMRAVDVIARTRFVLMRALAAVISALPLLYPLFVPVLGAIRLLILIGRLGHRVGLVTFLTCERWRAREREYAADAFAAAQEGTEPGIALFRGLVAGWRPRFSIFATHPTHTQRINRLLQAQSLQKTITPVTQGSRP